MRVAFITHYPELYGANRSLFDLLLELRRRNEVKPHVVLPREGPLSERLTAEGIPWAVVPFALWMSERHYMGRVHHRLMQRLRYMREARGRARTNAQVFPRLREQLHAWRIDLVHINSAAVGIAPLIVHEGAWPVVWHVREMPEKHYGLHLDAGRRAYGAALRKARRVIAISNAVVTDVRGYAGANVPVHVIPNGVFTEAEHVMLRDRAPQRWMEVTPFTFAMVGLIHPGKKQDEAVQAMALLRDRGRDVRLIIAGDGRDKRLRALIDGLKLGDRVRLAGFVPDVMPLLHEAHAMLMCSRDEAMGRATVEAMGSGLPVVGHASGATVELITDGVDGLLYPGGAEALAARMEQLVDDPARARELGERARTMVAGRFSVERMTDQVMEVYRSVMQAS